MDLISLDHQQVLSLLPDRENETHKGSYGRILLLCGSVGYTGAACLSALGALRSGAGLVYLGVPESIYPIVAGKLTEPIVFPLPDFEGKLSSRAIEPIKQRLANLDAVLIGPGLGVSSGTTQLVEMIEKLVGENYGE